MLLYWDGRSIPISHLFASPLRSTVDPHCYSLHANHSHSTTPSVDDQSTSDNLDNPEHPVPNYQEHRTRDLTVRSHSPQVQVPVRRLIDDGPSATTLVYDKRQIARSSRTSTQSGPVVGNCSPRSISTSYHITICTLEIRRRQIKSQATHVRLKVSKFQGPTRGVVQPE
jgi:hypothetical protein